MHIDTFVHAFIHIHYLSCMEKIWHSNIKVFFIKHKIIYHR